MGGVLPDWIEQVHGSAPWLLVAPHGGRRPERSALELDDLRKANDLHTALLTRELASRTNAAALINATRDRNELDCNRVSHVRRVPGFFATILREVHRQIAVRGEARVFFVHGWNAIQASCDVGIGARLEGGRMVPVREGRPTVPERFVPALLALGARGRDAGFEVVFGDRYPAATRDNVLQVFTERYANDRDPSIRELASLGTAGRIAAVQLELGIPLRWPGPLREQFVDTLCTWLTGRFGEDVIDVAPDSAFPSPESPRRVSLEFHDGTGGIGGFAAVERAAGGRRHARLLLCLGRSRLGLFTGEHPNGRGAPLSCAGFDWTESGNTARLDYDGPFLLFPDAHPFLDLESGLSRSRLVRLRARLDWRPDEPQRARMGRIRGLLDLDGSAHPIDAAAVLGPAPSPRLDGWHERRLLHVPLGNDLRLSVASQVASHETVSGEAVRAGRVEPFLSAHVQVHRPERAPGGFRIEVVTRSGPVRVFGQVTTAVPVVRTVDHHRTLTWFGLARFRADERVGHGTFEVATRLGETPRASTG